MKTLIASLANKWVVDPLWITKSKAEGEFLPEDGFVHLVPLQCPRYRCSLFVTLADPE